MLLMLTANKNGKKTNSRTEQQKKTNCSFYLSMRFTLITSKCVGLIGLKATMLCVRAGEAERDNSQWVCACKHALKTTCIAILTWFSPAKYIILTTINHFVLLHLCLLLCVSFHFFNFHLIPLRFRDWWSNSISIVYDHYMFVCFSYVFFLFRISKWLCIHLLICLFESSSSTFRSGWERASQRTR